MAGMNRSRERHRNKFKKENYNIPKSIKEI